MLIENEKGEVVIRIAPHLEKYVNNLTWIAQQHCVFAGYKPMSEYPIKKNPMPRAAVYTIPGTDMIIIFIPDIQTNLQLFFLAHEVAHVVRGSTDGIEMDHPTAGKLQLVNVGGCGGDGINLVNPNAETGQSAIDFVNCSDFEMKSVTVKDFTGRGGKEIDVKSSTFTGNRYNVYVADCDSMVMSGNNAKRSRSTGMIFWRVSNSAISGNLCNEAIGEGGLTADGMRFYGCSGNAITDNVCSENSGEGMSFILDSPTGTRCKNNTVSGNQCNGNMLTGLTFTGADHCIVTNNTCNNNGDQYGGGIWMGVSPAAYHANNCSVQNNTCVGNEGYGIYIQGDKNMVTNNDCQNNAIAQIRDDGTDTKLTPGNR